MKNLACLTGWFGLVAIAIVTSGCSLDSSLTGLKTDDAFSRIASPQAGEPVAGSVQFQDSITTHNYRVNATVGHVFDQISHTTTANGYKVYITVQGQIISPQ